MMRRTLLILATTAVLLTGFHFYSKYAREGVSPTRRLPVTVRPRPPGDATSQPAGLPSNVDGLLIVGRDETGRLEAIYRAKKLNRLPDGSHHLVEPRVELYQRNGQQTILRADEADVYGEQLDRGANIRRAKLRGNVTVYFDTSTEPDRKPVEQRPDEVVRVHADDVEFDREHLSLYTEGRVTVFAPQADVYGRGLSITWNESPRELRMLRIEHGQYIAVYNLPEDMNLFPPPGGQGPIAAPGQGGKVGVGGGPATKPAAHPATGPAAHPATQPAGPGDGDTTPAVAGTGAGAGKKHKGPVATQPTTRPKPQNQYLADFNEHVKVVRRDQRIYGADKLELRFDWDESWSKGSDGYVGSIRRRRREAASQPGSAPATQVASAPSAGGAKPGKTARSAVAAGGEKPGKPTDPADTEPLEVFWTGPLVLRPVGYTATPSRQQVVASGTGGRVVLTDPRGTATCREFLYRVAEQSGVLKAPAGERVRLLLAEGVDAASREIRFDVPAGRATLDEGGYMALRFNKGITQQQALALAETEDPNQAPPSARVTWLRNAEVAFEPEPAAPGKSKSKGTGLGMGIGRQFLRQLDFHQGVRFQQSSDPNDVSGVCKDLTVFMARGKRMAICPREAVATGDVYARQEGRDIRARKVTLRFRESEGGKPGLLQGFGSLGGRIDVSSVLAEGDVIGHDRPDRQDGKVIAVPTAIADRMSIDLLQQTAVLNGSPARIDRVPNHLAGPEIQFNQVDGSAIVVGKGNLAFLTNKDMNGNRLEQARPVRVDWTKGMAFQGERRTASFTGNVALDGGNDHMTCQEMQMIFAEGELDKPAKGVKPGKAGPASRPADAARPDAGGRLRGMAIGLERYSRRSIAMILADKDVTLKSRRENESGQLLRRIQLAGDKLIYDAEGGRMTMLGHGTFVAEDYDKPRPRRPVENEMLAPAVDRPSQTAFEWTRSMQFAQKDRLVTLDGGAKMVHRSAQQIILTDQLNVPRQLWGRLPEGRKSVLTCNNMMAKFGEARQEKDEPATGPSTGSAVRATTRATSRPATRPAADLLEKGPDLGPLDLFSATGDVNLKDGPRQVLAQRLIYNRLKDLAVIWGYLEGNPAANASILLEETEKGRSQAWSSPKIIWQRQDNKIVTEEVTGTGGR